MNETATINEVYPGGRCPTVKYTVIAKRPYKTLSAEITNPTTAAERSGTLENEVMPVTEKVKRLSSRYLVDPATLGGLTNSTVAWRNPTH
jgi:hypothetical protein